MRERTKLVRLKLLSTQCPHCRAPLIKRVDKISVMIDPEKFNKKNREPIMKTQKEIKKEIELEYDKLFKMNIYSDSKLLCCSNCSYAIRV